MFVYSIYLFFLPFFFRSMYVCVCMYVCMYLYVLVYICMYACIYIYIYIFLNLIQSYTLYRLVSNMFLGVGEGLKYKHEHCDSSICVSMYHIVDAE